MSTINKKTKTIFIHVPKTAGTSMEDMGFLGNVITRHYGIDHYDKEVDISKYFKFAFVRNPYDRLKSAILEHGLEGQKKTEKSFNNFLQKHKKMLNKWIATKPQYTFVCINGELKVDFIGKFENLLVDWAKVCKRLKVNETLTLAHDKKGLHRRDIRYNAESKKLVQRIYKKDFELFDYDEVV
jgi:hypothetical protein